MHEEHEGFGRFTAEVAEEETGKSEARNSKL